MSETKQIVIWSKQNCRYCQEVKGYLQAEAIPYREIDVTTKDHLREVLDTKYGIKHVPVVEIGDPRTGDYHAVTEVGLEPLKQALGKVAN